MKYKPNEQKALFRRTKEWKEFSRMLRDASNGICECCGTKSKTLQVHHKDDRIENYADISSLDHFAVLCHCCHKEVERLARIKPENWHKYNPGWVGLYSKFIIIPV